MCSLSKCCAGVMFSCRCIDMFRSSRLQTHCRNPQDTFVAHKVHFKFSLVCFLCLKYLEDWSISFLFLLFSMDENEFLKNDVITEKLHCIRFSNELVLVLFLDRCIPSILSMNIIIITISSLQSKLDQYFLHKIPKED